MERKKLLLAAAALLVVLTAVVYGWRAAGGRPGRPAEELAQAALAGGNAQHQQQAAAELSAAGGAAVPHMVRVLAESKEPEVRATMIQGVSLQWDYDSMPAILQALDDESFVVRLRAGEAAQRMTSVDVGYRADDPPEKRRAAAVRCRQEWEKLKDSAVLRLWKERLEKMGTGRGTP